jgi:RNA polymerase sigma factor (sigma-70 family)
MGKTIEQRNTLVMQVQNMFRGIVSAFCRKHNIISEKDEILSAINLQALRWADAYDPAEAEWSTYAHRCASLYCNNAWKDCIRREAKNFSDIVSIDSEEIDPTISREPLPDATILSLERSDELKASIAQLPENWQQVVNLRFWKNLNLRQIGERLGITRQRVEQIQKSAILELRNILENVTEKKLTKKQEWHCLVKEHQLSHTELAVWKQISTGKTCKLSPKQIDNALQRIRKKAERNKKEPTNE